jgi:hypothetical protein
MSKASNGYANCSNHKESVMSQRPKIEVEDAPADPEGMLRNLMELRRPTAMEKAIADESSAGLLEISARFVLAGYAQTLVNELYKSVYDNLRESTGYLIAQQNDYVNDEHRQMMVKIALRIIEANYEAQLGMTNQMAVVMARIASGQLRPYKLEKPKSTWTWFLEEMLGRDLERR